MATRCCYANRRHNFQSSIQRRQQQQQQHGRRLRTRKPVYLLIYSLIDWLIYLLTKIVHFHAWIFGPDIFLHHLSKALGVNTISAK